MGYYLVWYYVVSNATSARFSQTSAYGLLWPSSTPQVGKRSHETHPVKSHTYFDSSVLPLQRVLKHPVPSGMMLHWTFCLFDVCLAWRCLARRCHQPGRATTTPNDIAKRWFPETAVFKQGPERMSQQQVQRIDLPLSWADWDNLCISRYHVSIVGGKHCRSTFNLFPTTGSISPWACFSWAYQQHW